MRLRSDRIDALVAGSGISINDIAKTAEISPEHVWKLRNGKSPNVSAEVLARLANVFGVSLDYLMGMERDDEGMPIPEPDVAELVARLNSLPAKPRRRALALMTGILDFSLDASAELVAEVSSRLLDLLPPEEQSEMRAAIARDGRRYGLVASEAPTAKTAADRRATA